MTQNDFTHILSSLNGLSPDQMRRLLRELESKMASVGKSNADVAEESAFDVASRAGLIGCIQGAPDSPTDLSTNPKHMEGFGRG
jgi:hypothetical protein